MGSSGVRLAYPWRTCYLIERTISVPLAYHQHTYSLIVHPLSGLAYHERTYYLINHLLSYFNTIRVPVPVACHQRTISIPLVCHQCTTHAP
jgi:hypothetical protein